MNSEPRTTVQELLAQLAKAHSVIAELVEHIHGNEHIEQIDGCEQCRRLLERASGSKAWMHPPDVEMARSMMGYAAGQTPPEEAL